VIVLIHFGVSWSVGSDGSHRPDPQPVIETCGPFQHAVDAIVLGHTLGRFADVIDGVPYTQPWAFGAEVGVIDLDLQTGGRTVELLTVEEEPTAWTGAGHAAIDAALHTVIGHLDAALRIDFDRDISLASYAAQALRIAAGTTGAVVPVVGMHQPAIEGVMYRWPAGPVTEADLSRFWPWTEDRCLVAQLTSEELALIAAFTAPESWLAWGTSSAPELHEEQATIAVPRDYVDWATIQIREILGRPLTWQPVEIRLRDAIRAALALSSRRRA
jgi:2',3'-cyclic-nucleotide 2'-phosphodiesterase (5'-nucleotidase family)